tara:strand:- start:67 stop:258 length:192 start_codon:yes stop_codon:yes gene_type:complete
MFYDDYATVCEEEVEVEEDKREVDMLSVLDVYTEEEEMEDSYRLCRYEKMAIRFGLGRKLMVI